jgi:hypothetical protein
VASVRYESFVFDRPTFGAPRGDRCSQISEVAHAAAVKILKGTHMARIIYFFVASALFVASVEAMAVKAPSTLHSGLHRWLTSEAIGGFASPSLALSESPLCGSGLFAAEHIARNEQVGCLPFDACINAETALRDPAIGIKAQQFVESFGSSPGVQVILVASLLAQARFCEGAARFKWAPYVDTLPWGANDAPDTLVGHPLVVGVDCTLADVGGCEERLGSRLEGARRAAAAIHQVLDGAVSEEDCLRAYVIVGSRAVDLSPWWDHQVPESERLLPSNWSIVMIPYFDNANHPSMALLGAASNSFGERFRAIDGHPRYGTMRLEPDFRAQQLRIYSPPALEMLAGDELLNYVRVTRARARLSMVPTNRTQMLHPSVHRAGAHAHARNRPTNAILLS